MKDLQQYDKYIVAFSGGKDSIACFLYLLELGIPKSKIELWHSLVDGEEEAFMDWEVTEDYCRKFGEAFKVPVYFSWKEGGFKREMMRKDSLTAPTTFETPEGRKTVGGTRGKKNTRRRFPQISPDLTVRWCSPYLKIDVCAAGIRNQKRFNGIKTVVLSGERGEESAARGRYSQLEPDRADLRDGKASRLVDRARPIREWKECQVWAIIERHHVVVHPCYYMGWSRCSCKLCIFGNADQFASAFHVSPNIGEEMVRIEEDFGVTLKRKESLPELVSKGSIYDSITSENINQSTSRTYQGKIFTNNWVLPAGAYGESCGPT